MQVKLVFVQELTSATSQTILRNCVRLTPFCSPNVISVTYGGFVCALQSLHPSTDHAINCIVSQGHAHALVQSWRLLASRLLRAVRPAILVCGGDHLPQSVCDNPSVFCFAFARKHVVRLSAGALAIADHAQLATAQRVSHFAGDRRGLRNRD